MFALLSISFGLALLVGGLRFPRALDLLTLQAADPARWAMLCGVALGLGAIALRREGREGRMPWRSAARAAFWWVLVATPALLWTFGDLAIERGLDLFVVAVAFAVGAAVWWKSGHPSPRVWGATRANLMGALLPTLAGAALLWWWRDRVGPPELEPSGADWALALATYPLYAAVQMLLFLVWPQSQWKRDGFGVAARVVGISLLFAFVHWPNPSLVLLTGVGMLFWSRAWIAGAGLVPLALSMGLLGAIVAQGLPTDANGHARVGPGYVLRVDRIRRTEAFDRRVTDLASDARFEAAGGTLDAWLRALHREAFDQPIDDDVLRAWVRRIEDAHRSRIVRIFMEGAEYRRKRGFDRTMVDDDRFLLHSTFRPEAHAAYAPYDELRSRATLEATGGFVGFLRLCYERLLDRGVPDEQLADWPRVPEDRHRVEIVRLFLRAAGEEDPDLFRADRELEWWPGDPPPR